VKPAIPVSEAAEAGAVEPDTAAVAMNAAATKDVKLRLTRISNPPSNPSDDYGGIFGSFSSYAIGKST
jgi:hypothetical protein